MAMIEQEKLPSDVLTRKKRVQRIKKMIIGFILAAIIIPIILCIILFIQVAKLKTEVRQLQQAKVQERLEKQVLEERLSAKRASETEKISQSELDSEVEKTVTAGLDTEDGRKKVYLTFDDGPSIYTEDILDICDTYGVCVTFFVVGKEGEANDELLRKIVAKGHSLGVHSYSHKYNEIYSSMDAYAADFTKMKEHIYQVTGVMPTLCRFPGGSSNTVSKIDMQDVIRYVEGENMTYFDWNISSQDATGKQYLARELADNVLDHIDDYNECVVLLHDANSKTRTVEALPLIIEALQARGDIDILPITQDTNPIVHLSIKE